MTISTLLLDIGGVLLSNGWGRPSRQQAAEVFHPDYDDLEEHHHLTYDTYEEGKISLDDYLQRVVFCQNRPFSVDEFKAFMLDRTQPDPEMIDFIRVVKLRNRLKTIAVRNVGREINAYRIHSYGLDQLIEPFGSSCFVHYRKPDPDIYRIALDISLSIPEQVAYIDERPLIVEITNSLGNHGIQHIDVATTRSLLEQLGLMTQ